MKLQYTLWGIILFYTLRGIIAAYTLRGMLLVWQQGLHFTNAMEPILPIAAFDSSGGRTRHLLGDHSTNQSKAVLIAVTL